MISECEPPSSVGQSTALPIDHIGIVVADLDREASLWRAEGFAVSEPVQLLGNGGAPLGQRSAHVVFDNAYVELSSPLGGSGNHLEPYLALGEGTRIVVLAADDADLARERLAELGRPAAPCAEASRPILIDGATGIARFRWFALPAESAPGLLCAVVEHLTPELVFHPALRRHPNGLRRIAEIHASGHADGLLSLAGRWLVTRPVPKLMLRRTDGPLRIVGLAMTTAQASARRHFRIRGGEEI